MQPFKHQPVLVREIIELLALKPDAIVVDGTLGSAGHALELLKLLGPKAKYIALDQDKQSLERVKSRLTEYPQVSLQHKNFKDLDKVLENLNIREVDAVLLDVGFSSDQLENAARGFSFDRNGPLDMRMNPDDDSVTAKDLVHALSQKELEDVFRNFGEEPRARYFAEKIVEARKKVPIETTFDLVAVLTGCKQSDLENQDKRWWRRHPATKVFQALRIAVNQELEALKQGLEKGWSKLRPGGRIAIISFHSLEDRIVKNFLKDRVKEGAGRLVAKKAVQASREEEVSNPRSRSAKLRVAEKI